MQLLSSRILMSLGMIVFVGALAAGATGAFFSDTETSTGNTFAAGALDLTIDNSSYGFDWNRPGVTAPTGAWGANPSNSWQLGDLNNCGDGNDPCLFFSFGDLKPGDYGEDTISLHVQNAAYACMAFDLTGTPENLVNEPEASFPDTTVGADQGELQNYLSFLFWYDDGDNVFESGETVIPALSGLPGSAFTGQWLAIADSGSGTPLVPGVTNYIGKGWCFGAMTQTPATPAANPNGPTPGNTGFTCSGAGNQNDAQTDGIAVDVHFYAEQSRNNGQFLCSALPPLVGTGPVAAASYATGFEPGEGFAPGNINGQAGWQKTGSYDAEVESSPVIANVQSLRISNAVTSGSFGDQTFTPNLALGAGETGVGDSENHFEAEFDIKSTTGAHQPGLVLSVSPDDGNGARMSFLRFEDQADGIHVIFSEVTNAGPLPTVSSFSLEDIATIDHTNSHTIKFVMDFVDGAGNDVVKIYVDGILEKTGTSWENYYRFDPEQTGGGNVLSEVDSLIFRASATAVPANSGNGFLFDKVSLLSSTI